MNAWSKIHHITAVGTIAITPTAKKTSVYESVVLDGV